MSLTPKLTDAGRGLLIRALFGETLNFTRLKIGSGDTPSDPSAGDYWYNTAAHQLYFYTAGWAEDARSITYGPDEPDDPASGDLWYDTAADQLREYLYAWRLSGEYGITVVASATEPAGTDADYWIDTDAHTLNVYDGTAWVEDTDTPFTYGSVGPAVSDSGDFWYNTSNGRLYVYGGKWTPDGTPIYFAEPVDPAKGDLWYDTTSEVLKVYVKTWAVSSENFTRSSSAPADPAAGDLWYNTAAAALMRCNGSAWTPVTDAGYSESSSAPDSADDLTDLINTEMSLDITAFAKGSGLVSLSAAFDNSGVTRAFRWTETGVFAADADGVEYLYAYCHAGQQYDTIPANTLGRTVSVSLTVIVAVDDAENITAVIGEGAQYVTREQYEEHVGNRDNPHGVTKEQVGLGNAVNLAPGDYEVTYSTPGSLTAPVSGEKLTVFMGKVRRAVSNLISHLQAQNPHGITPSKIGAASASHRHGTADLDLTWELVGYFPLTLTQSDDTVIATANMQVLAMGTLRNVYVWFNTGGKTVTGSCLKIKGFAAASVNLPTCGTAILRGAGVSVLGWSSVSLNEIWIYNTDSISFEPHGTLRLEYMY